MSSDTVSMSSSFAALDDLSTESGSELSHRPSGSRPPLPRPASTPDLVAGAGGTPMYAAPEVMRSMFSGSRKGEAVIPKVRIAIPSNSTHLRVQHTQWERVNLPYSAYAQNFCFPSMRLLGHCG